MAPSPHKQLYNRRRWRRRSVLQRKMQPLCEACKAEGQTEIATHCHHVVEHHGNETLFWFGELRSLCLRHHLQAHGRKMREFSTEIGSDGWPVDARHSVYRTDAARREA